MIDVIATKIVNIFGSICIFEDFCLSFRRQKRRYFCHADYHRQREGACDPLDSLMMMCYDDLITFYDQVDDDVQVGDVDLAVVVQIGSGCTGMASVAAHDDNINHAVGIGDSDLTVAIHVTRDVMDSLVDDPAILNHVAEMKARKIRHLHIEIS